MRACVRAATAWYSWPPVMMAGWRWLPGPSAASVRLWDTSLPRTNLAEGAMREDCRGGRGRGGRGSRGRQKPINREGQAGRGKQRGVETGRQ